MKKNKLDKRDIACSILLAFSFIIFVLMIVRFKYYYGSTLDWESQHSTIPELFRMLFYKTKDLLPDFAFNLGGGQNIYNFAYYGFLSPIIVLSYLFPFIKMIDYVVLSSIVVVIASAILFYFWLRRNQNAGHFTAYLCASALMFATCLSFHSHRHVMFMNYMPFMILGLFGVDKKLTSSKGWLLSLSVFLMIMTSYYYSVGGIIGLVLYGIYKWISINEKVSVKKFFKDGFKFLFPIIVGIFMASIILLPTLHVILSSRGETFNTITWKDLFIPGLNIEYILYNTYGIGLTSVAVVAIVNLLFKRRENLYLGVLLSLIVLFPVFNYLLNATMYVDAKALIPLLPLVVYAIYILIEDLLNRSTHIKKVCLVVGVITVILIIKGDLAKYFLPDLVVLSLFLLLYYIFKKKVLLAIPVIALPIICSLATSYSDELVSYKRVQDLQKEYKDVLSSITDEEKGIYRISNAKTILRDVNNLYGNIDYYTSTLYSSTYNLGYNKFYYDVMNNPIQNRNRVITSPTANILFLMFSGNKYLIDNQANYFGYDLYKEVQGNKIYKNEDVLPIMYVRSDILSVDDYNKLKYPDKALALLQNVVVEDRSNIEYESSINEMPFDESRLEIKKDLKITKENGNYKIEAGSDSLALYDIPSEYRNKIVFVRFKMLDNASCSEGDTHIVIDGVKNKLTCKSWKYHNQNFDFDYVLANKDRDQYIIQFSEGTYRISDIELYYIDYEDISNIKDNIDEFNFNMDKTKGDYIIGNVDVKNAGYFVTSIPYDEGFSIEVDGERCEPVKLNEAFLGFKIDKGSHDIKIVYSAPWKKEACFVSIIGFIMFAICTFMEHKKTTE